MIRKRSRVRRPRLATMAPRRFGRGAGVSGKYAAALFRWGHRRRRCTRRAPGVGTSSYYVPGMASGRCIRSIPATPKPPNWSRRCGSTGAGRPLLNRFGSAGAVTLSAIAGVVRWTAGANSAAFPVMAAGEPLHGLTFGLLHQACMDVIGEDVPISAAPVKRAVSPAAAKMPWRHPVLGPCHPK